MGKGILKNAIADASYRKESPNELAGETSFDRKAVIANTLLNAQAGKARPAGTAFTTRENDDQEHLSEEQLKWDEKNLIINELGKSATMKIDEPKTPYEGGFDPNNDYYREDNEEEKGEAIDEDDGFVLGEGEDDADDVENGDIEKVDSGSEESQEESASYLPDAASKHSKFEEMRRRHYHMKALPLKKKVFVEEEGEEQDNSNNHNDIQDNDRDNRNVD